MPPPTVRTEITIEAPPSRVYAVLVDFPKWREWNPFIVEAEGAATEGERLKLRFNDGMRFEPVVEAAKPGERLQWLGKLWNVGGLFDGRHVFELEEVAGGRTRLLQHEEFAGVLARPLMWAMGDKVAQNFAKLNEALKRRVESSS